MTDNRIRKVVIVGGGTAGWMAAAALSRTFGKLLDIELIESDAIGTVGVGEATIPQIKLFLGALGIDENDFLRRVNGTIKLGIQFHDWARPGDVYMHAFGPVGLSLGMLPFHHYWLRMRLHGRGTDLWSYSLNERVAIAQRFDRIERVGDTPIPGLAYAYHFDAALVARFLREFSERHGVRRREGIVTEVRQRPNDGFIESLMMEDGSTVDGELFIDCSGFRGLLIEQTLEAGYEDWTHWLPCDRAVAVPCASAPPLTPYTQSLARPAGWQWRIPLQSRIGNGHVFASSCMSDDEATGILLDNLDGEALAEPRVIRFRTGMRKQFWDRNCVALGLASGFMEPLESTSIHLVQSGIQRLIEYFPDRSFAASDRDQYNRESRFEFERIRDFLILHYHANQREDSEFWRSCRHMDIPDSLRNRLDLFETAGRLYREGQELFTEVGWLQVLIGQHVLPAAYHPLADLPETSQLERFMDNIQRIIAKAATQLPDHAEFIRENCAAQEGYA